MMIPTVFVDETYGCITKGKLELPSLNMPGLPNMVLGCFMASLAGINYILKFLPPDPLNLPKPPSMKIFVDGFMGGINIPSPSIPPFTLGAEIGLPNITIPGVGIEPPSYDLSGQLGLIKVFILLPAALIKLIITSFPVIKLPSPSTIKLAIGNIGLQVGLPIATIDMFAGCLSGTMFKLIKSAVPV